MTVNEWLANVGVPAGLREPIFHPGIDKQQETFQKYPDAGSFVQGYGFEPIQGWYDPKTGKPMVANVVSGTAPNQAIRGSDSIRKAMQGKK